MHGQQYIKKLTDIFTELEYNFFPKIYYVKDRWHFLVVQGVIVNFMII